MPPPTRHADSATLDLFADTASSAPPPLTPAATLAALRTLTDAGLLRHIDTALTAQLHQQAPETAPCVLVACALLAQMEGRGHSCLPLAQLLPAPLALLGPAEGEAQASALAALWTQLPPRLADWLAALRACRWVRQAEADADQGQPLVLAGGGEGTPARLYLRRYWQHEQAVAQHIRARCQDEPAQAIAPTAARGWLARFFPAPPETDASAPDWQKIACALALRGRLTVITGGPGTGKTYTAARLLALLFATAPQPEQLRVALAAPTGKAAARLKQSIDDALGALQAQVGADLDLNALVQRVGAARTLHSLLGARPGTRHFSRHAGQPLEVDVLIVDEASMVHLEMMAALLAALPPNARLVLLGDKDQLASVEAGAVLGDLCQDAAAGRYSAATADWVAQVAGESLPAAFLAPGAAPPLAQHTAMLRASRRFGGPIGALAQAVNQGDAASALAVLQEDASGAVAQITGSHPAQAVQLAWPGRPGGASYADYAQQLARWPALAPAAGGAPWEATHADWVRAVLQAFERFRLLCAVRAGDWGVDGLNRAVQAALVQARVLPAHAATSAWYAGRPVMVTRNDPLLGVFNGDVGIALPASGAGHPLRVYFAQGAALHSVAVTRLAHVETAFAMTVHKSQGSEFAHTALVLAAGSGQLLSRELVYTGITRARSTFTLVEPQPGLLAQAVRQPTERASGLAQALAPNAHLQPIVR
jgi:exodeoxyribonuclease V alpha subunit